MDKKDVADRPSRAYRMLCTSPWWTEERLATLPGLLKDPELVRIMLEDYKEVDPNRYLQDAAQAALRRAYDGLGWSWSEVMPYYFRLHLRRYFQIHCQYLRDIAGKEWSGGSVLSEAAWERAPAWLRPAEDSLRALHTILPNDALRFLDTLVETTCDNARSNRRLTYTHFKELTTVWGVSGGERRVLRLWGRARGLALHRLRALLAAGDRPRQLARDAALTARDWRLADLLMLYDSSVNVVTEDSLTMYEQLRVLTALLHLVQTHNLEERGSIEDWTAALKDYTSRGTCASLVLLQKRWHEMKEGARAAVTKYWLAGGTGTPPLPIHLAIVERFPYVVTEELPKWMELVRSGKIHDACLVYGDDESVVGVASLPPTDVAPPPAGPTQQYANTETDDDIILIENDIETIDLAAFDDDNEDEPRPLVIEEAPAADVKQEVHDYRQVLLTNRQVTRTPVQFTLSLQTDGQMQQHRIAVEITEREQQSEALESTENIHKSPTGPKDVNLNSVTNPNNQDTIITFTDNRSVEDKSNTEAEANNRPTDADDQTVENISMLDAFDLDISSENMGTEQLNPSFLAHFDPNNAESTIIFSDDDDKGGNVYSNLSTDRNDSAQISNENNFSSLVNNDDNSSSNVIEENNNSSQSKNDSNESNKSIEPQHLINDDISLRNDSAQIINENNDTSLVKNDENNSSNVIEDNNISSQIKIDSNEATKSIEPQHLIYNDVNLRNDSALINENDDSSLVNYDKNNSSNVIKDNNNSSQIKNDSDEANKNTKPQHLINDYVNLRNDSAQIINVNNDSSLVNNDENNSSNVIKDKNNSSQINNDSNEANKSIGPQHLIKKDRNLPNPTNDSDELSSSINVADQLPKSITVSKTSPQDEDIARREADVFLHLPSNDGEWSQLANKNKKASHLICNDQGSTHLTNIIEISQNYNDTKENTHLTRDTKRIDEDVVAAHLTGVDSAHNCDKQPLHLVTESEESEQLNNDKEAPQKCTSNEKEILKSNEYNEFPHQKANDNNESSNLADDDKKLLQSTVNEEIPPHTADCGNTTTSVTSDNVEAHNLSNKEPSHLATDNNQFSHLTNNETQPIHSTNDKNDPLSPTCENNASTIDDEKISNAADDHNEHKKSTNDTNSDENKLPPSSNNAEGLIKLDISQIANYLEEVSHATISSSSSRDSTNSVMLVTGSDNLDEVDATTNPKNNHSYAQNVKDSSRQPIMESDKLEGNSSNARCLSICDDSIDSQSKRTVIQDVIDDESVDYAKDVDMKLEYCSNNKNVTPNIQLVLSEPNIDSSNEIGKISTENYPKVIPSELVVKTYKNRRKIKTLTTAPVPSFILRELHATPTENLPNLDLEHSDVSDSGVEIIETSSAIVQSEFTYNERRHTATLDHYSNTLKSSKSVLDSALLNAIRKLPKETNVKRHVASRNSALNEGKQREAQGNASDVDEVSDLYAKLLQTPQVRVIKLDRLPFWRKYSRNNSIDLSRVDLHQFRDARAQFEQARVGHGRTRNTKTYSSRDFSTNPDFDIRLKNLWPNFFRHPRNVELLEQCKPVTIDLERVCAGAVRRHRRPERESRRVAKPVELPDIEEVRRINSGILTAQVAPINADAHKNFTAQAAGSRSSRSCVLFASRRRKHARRRPSELSGEAGADSAGGGCEAEGEVRSGAPSMEQLQELLKRIGDGGSSSERSAPVCPRPRPFCCVARRHRAVNDARRRLCERAGRPLPPETPIHAHAKDDRCTCCCVHLLKEGGEASVQRLRSAASALQHALKDLLIPDACAPTPATKRPASSTDTSVHNQANKKPAPSNNGEKTRTQSPGPKQKTKPKKKERKSSNKEKKGVKRKRDEDSKQKVTEVAPADAWRLRPGQLYYEEDSWDSKYYPPIPKKPSLPIVTPPWLKHASKVVSSNTKSLLKQYLSRKEGGSNTTDELADQGDGEETGNGGDGKDDDVMPIIISVTSLSEDGDVKARKEGKSNTTEELTGQGDGEETGGDGEGKDDDVMPIITSVTSLSEDGDVKARKEGGSYTTEELADQGDGEETGGGGEGKDDDVMPIITSVTSFSEDGDVKARKEGGSNTTGELAYQGDGQETGGGGESKDDDVMPIITSVTSLSKDGGVKEGTSQNIVIFGNTGRRRARPALVARVAGAEGEIFRCGPTPPPTLPRQQTAMDGETCLEDDEVVRQGSSAPLVHLGNFLRDKDTTEIPLVCIDLDVPRLWLAGQHVVVTRCEVPMTRPSYWTFQPKTAWRRVVFPDEEAATKSEQQPKRQRMLKVRASAKLFDADNALDTSNSNDASQDSVQIRNNTVEAENGKGETGPSKVQTKNSGVLAPDLVNAGGRLFKNLGERNNPLYAEVLSVVSDPVVCRRLLYARAGGGKAASEAHGLMVMNMRTGRLHDVVTTVEGRGVLHISCDQPAVARDLLHKTSGWSKLVRIAPKPPTPAAHHRFHSDDDAA